MKSSLVVATHLTERADLLGDPVMGACVKNERPSRFPSEPTAPVSALRVHVLSSAPLFGADGCSQGMAVVASFEND
jgi:hypothetical protein